MKLKEFLTQLNLASCPHGRTRGPYVELCDHLKMLHAQLIQNPHFAAALADEEDEDFLDEVFGCSPMDDGQPV